jgi:hypothetical protein
VQPAQRGVSLPRIHGTDEERMNNVKDEMPNTPSAPTEGAHIWWRHEFYRLRWNKWHGDWRKLVAASSTGGSDSPREVLKNLSSLGCDPEISVRLAFLVACRKPLAQSELAKDTKRQQRIKRKLQQSQKRFLDSARLLEELSGEFPLIFITPEHVRAARITAQLCAYEVEVLLEPRALELPTGHELFTLIAYVKACSAKPNYELVTALLKLVYEAGHQHLPSKDAISKHPQRFAPGTNYPDLINETTAARARSGELRKDLIACFPGQVLP